MKLKATITEGAHQEMFWAFGSRLFARRFMDEIVSEVFGVEKPEERPAEFFVQKPDSMVALDGEVKGVVLALSGVSRGKRPPKVFHDALKNLEQLAMLAAHSGLKIGESIQVWVVIFLDGEIETAPGSGEYARLIESEPQWVTRQD